LITVSGYKISGVSELLHPVLFLLSHNTLLQAQSAMIGQCIPPQRLAADGHCRTVKMRHCSNRLELHVLLLCGKGRASSNTRYSVMSVHPIQLEVLFSSSCSTSGHQCHRTVCIRQVAFQSLVNSSNSFVRLTYNGSLTPHTCNAHQTEQVPLWEHLQPTLKDCLERAASE
jgi:hypothetical protein